MSNIKKLVKWVIFLLFKKKNVKKNFFDQKKNIYQVSQVLDKFFWNVGKIIQNQLNFFFQSCKIGEKFDGFQKKNF